MVEEAYESALRQALNELVDVDRQAEEIERRRATLRQSIAVLQTLAGNRSGEERPVSGSILTILKASPRPLPTAQIIQRLQMMGHKPQPASVATLLSRLAKDGKIMKADDGYGIDQIDLENPKTWTDVVLLVMKDTGWEESLPATEVVDRIARLIGHVDPRKIESILAEHASQKDRLIDGRNSMPDGSGVPVYYFRGPARNQTERTKARRAVVDMDKIGLGKGDSGRPLTFTEAILFALQDSPGFVTAVEVEKRLFKLGYFAAQPNMVATILSNMAKDGKINGAIGPNGLVGYGLKEETTKKLREAAERFEQQTQVRRRSTAG